MKVIFGRNSKPLSLLIRLFTWSRFSHVGIIYGDYVIESTLSKGVTKTPLVEFKKRYTSLELCEMPSNENHGDRALSQLGKKYDLLSVFSIFFRTGWNKENKWFCSELVAYASGIYRSDRINRVTPEDIYKVSKS